MICFNIVTILSQRHQVHATQTCLYIVVYALAKLLSPSSVQRISNSNSWGSKLCQRGQMNAGQVLLTQKGLCALLFVLWVCDLSPFFAAADN